MQAGAIPTGLKAFIVVHALEASFVTLATVTTVLRLGATSPSGTNVLFIWVKVVPVLVLFIVGTIKRFRWLPPVVTLYYAAATAMTVVELFEVTQYRGAITAVSPYPHTYEVLAGALLALLVQCQAAMVIFWTRRSFFSGSTGSRCAAA